MEMVGTEVSHAGAGDGDAINEGIDAFVWFARGSFCFTEVVFRPAADLDEFCAEGHQGGHQDVHIIHTVAGQGLVEEETIVL